MKGSRHLRELEECAALRLALCRRYPNAAHGLQALHIHPRALRQVGVFAAGLLPDAVWRRVAHEPVAIRTEVHAKTNFVSTVADGIWLPPSQTMVSLPGRPTLTLWNAERTREPDLLWFLCSRGPSARTAVTTVAVDSTTLGLWATRDTDRETLSGLVQRGCQDDGS